MKFGKKNMSHKIGIFGSSADEADANSKEKAKQLGRILNSHKLTIITGACSGLPYITAKEGSGNGNPVWGFSPMLDLYGQKKFTPKDDLSIYKRLIFIPSNFEFANNEQVCKKYRNVISTANCDVGIIISGRWGTMNEFTNLYDMGKVIGILTGTGGVADELPYLMKKVFKKTKAKIFFEDSPKKLIELVINCLTEQQML